jgi:hypothetical protein
MDWSVKIVPAANPTPSAPAAFQPDLMNSQPGDPLYVQDDDIVTWNNTTDDTHWPWPTDANFKPVAQDPVTKDPVTTDLKLSDPIEPNMSSRPSYNVLKPDGGTIYYCCWLHQEERGTIVVSAIPSTTASTT